jgi:hypothetical protein
VYSSADEGRAFRTADYQTAPVGDWEKLMVGPPPTNASAAERLTGYPNVVYVCGNSTAEVIGPGRLCYGSLDGVASFAMAGFVTPFPTMPADSCPPLAANTGVVGRDGTVFQPVSCNSASYIAVSEDEGASYTVRRVPAAGASGQFGVAYYGSTDAKATNLTLYITQTADALDSNPLLLSGALNDPAHPIYTDASVSSRSPRADYIGAAFDEGGMLWAGAVKQLGTPDFNGNQATTGYVGHLLGPTRKRNPAWLSAYRACGRRGSFTIRLHDLRGTDRLVSARVYVNGKQVAVRRGRRLAAPIQVPGCHGAPSWSW